MSTTTATTFLDLKGSPKLAQRSGWIDLVAGEALECLHELHTPHPFVPARLKKLVSEHLDTLGYIRLGAEEVCFHSHDVVPLAAALDSFDDQQLLNIRRADQARRNERDNTSRFEDDAFELVTFIRTLSRYHGCACQECWLRALTRLARLPWPGVAALWNDQESTVTRQHDHSRTRLASFRATIRNHRVMDADFRAAGHVRRLAGALLDRALNNQGAQHDH